MGDSAFESWDVKGESSSKILIVRTHPEELHAPKVWESSNSKKPFLGNFRGAQFFGMSSYDKIFFMIEKYGPQAFKIRVGNVSTTSS